MDYKILKKKTYRDLQLNYQRYYLKRCQLKIDSSTIKRGFKDLERTYKNKIKVFGLALEIYNKANSIKRSKKQPINNWKI